MCNRIRQKFVNSFKFVVSPSKAIYNILSLLIHLADKFQFVFLYVFVKALPPITNYYFLISSY